MATPDVQVAAEGRAKRTSNFWPSRFVFPILILLIIAGFYWKITLTNQFDWVWGPDMVQQVLPWFEEEARQVEHRELPLWDEHEWAGQPMLGQAQPGTAYPLNWILFSFPRSQGHIRPVVLHWYYIAIHFMAAWFCYLLCRDLRRSQAASLIAGLVFSLAGYVGTTDWPQMVNGAVWAPLVFMFQLRAARGYRTLVSAALCGAFLGMAWLAGHHQVPIFITLTMGGIWLYFILRGANLDRNVLKLAAVSVLFMVLVGGLQIIPAQEYGLLAKRWAGGDHPLSWYQPVPYTVHDQYGLKAISLFAILIPGLNRNADPFVGVVALGLALFAVALTWRYLAVKIFAAVAVGGIVYSLAAHSVFQGFLYAIVPMVEKARVPSMAVIIFNVGIAVLVAYGLDEIPASAGSVWARRLTIGILAFGVLLYAFILLALFVNKMAWSSDDRVMITALVAILMAALIYGWRSGNLSSRQAFVLMTLLILFELGNDSGYTFPHLSDKTRTTYLQQVRGSTEIAAFLHQQPGIYRIEVDTDKLSPNWGTYQNFDIVRALGASVTANMLELEWHTFPTRMLLGVRYTVSEKAPSPDSREVYNGPDGLNVYENFGAFSRAWAVHELVESRNSGDVRVAIVRNVADLRSKAFMAPPVRVLPPCAALDEVSFSRYTAEKVILSAQMGCDGMVILSDTYYPGWRARVDGKAERIYQVDNALRGVYVPKGEHEIVMEYRPRSVYLGAALTALGWLGVAGLSIFGKKT